IPFRYCIQGRPLRGTILPPRIALFRHDAGLYEDDGHTQDLILNGPCANLRHPIFHDDRKPLSRWLWAQNRYLKLEAQKLQQTPSRLLSRADQVRKNTVLAPFAVFVLCLIWQRSILDGWRGWFYALQRLYAETLLTLMLLEARLQRP
ncbi:MAG: glycosyltransferase family 2 protein, partial [Cyanobium sp.]